MSFFNHRGGNAPSPLMKKFILLPLLVLLFSLSLVLPAFAVSVDSFNYIAFNSQNYVTQTSPFDHCLVRLYGKDGKYLLDLGRAESGITWQATSYVTGNINSSGTGNFNAEFYLSDYINIYGKKITVDFQRTTFAARSGVTVDGDYYYYNFDVPLNTSYSETTSYGNIRMSAWNTLTGLRYFTFVIPAKDYKIPVPISGSGSQFDSTVSTSKYSGWYYFLFDYIWNNKNIANDTSFEEKPAVLNLFINCTYEEFVRYESQYNTTVSDKYYNDVINGTTSQQQQSDTSRQNTDNAIGKITDASNALDSYVPADVNANNFTFSSITDGLNVNSSLSIFTNILNQPFVLQICLIVFSLMLIGFIFFGER